MQTDADQRCAVPCHDNKQGAGLATPGTAITATSVRKRSTQHGYPPLDIKAPWLGFTTPLNRRKNDACLPTVSGQHGHVRRLDDSITQVVALASIIPICWFLPRN